LGHSGPYGNNTHCFNNLGSHTLKTGKYYQDGDNEDRQVSARVCCVDVICVLCLQYLIPTFQCVEDVTVLQGCPVSLLFARALTLARSHRVLQWGPCGTMRAPTALGRCPPITRLPCISPSNKISKQIWSTRGAGSAFDLWSSRRIWMCSTSAPAGGPGFGI